MTLVGLDKIRLREGFFPCKNYPQNYLRMEIASELLQFAMLPSAPAVKFSDDLVNNYVTTAVDSLPADIVNNILRDR